MKKTNSQKKNKTMTVYKLELHEAEQIMTSFFGCTAPLKFTQCICVMLSVRVGYIQLILTKTTGNVFSHALTNGNQTKLLNFLTRLLQLKYDGEARGSEMGRWRKFADCEHSDSAEEHRYHICSFRKEPFRPAKA